MNNNNILNRIFSRNTFRHIIENGTDESYVTVVKRFQLDCNKKNGKLISEIYTELDREYRNEYFYKNTLLNKLLLGKHSINTTSALTEIPIDKSKADFVLINGKAVVYEIKTDLDNFDRLQSQINDYYKAFDNVVVITGEAGVEKLERKVKAIDKPIGICVLQKNNRIKTVCEPKSYVKDLDKTVIFKIMRKQEYEHIIQKYYGELPLVSQFKYYKECKSRFMEIPINEIYNEFITILKKRMVITRDELNRVPYELKFLAYFMDLKEEDYKKLELFLGSELGGV